DGVADGGQVPFAVGDHLHHPGHGLPVGGDRLPQPGGQPGPVGHLDPQVLGLLDLVRERRHGAHQAATSSISNCRICAHLAKTRVISASSRPPVNTVASVLLYASSPCRSDSLSPGKAVISMLVPGRSRSRAATCSPVGTEVTTPSRKW